jgi:hypothetical protein
MFGFTARCWRRSGAARTIDEGQGQALKSITDNAGLALKTLLVPLIIPPAGRHGWSKRPWTPLGEPPEATGSWIPCHSELQSTKQVILFTWQCKVLATAAELFGMSKWNHPKKQNVKPRRKTVSNHVRRHAN